ncbi:MAG: cell division protein FtsL [Mariprofundaceae bacterium]|nr:cell division protein FtsL [Mariprofundaceae bacterium]
MVVFYLLLGGLALAQVWLAHLRVDMARQRHAVQVAIKQEEKKIDKLSLEYANLIRPERLRKLAHEQLGMHAPRPDQLIQR